eukprot:RCo042324
MPDRRSTRKGPVHQNSTGYDHLRNCKRHLPPEKIFADMHAGMCAKCRKLMDWKRKYGKWKVYGPKHGGFGCDRCGRRTVLHPYAVQCKDCVLATRTCAKCYKPETEEDRLHPYSLSMSEQARLENSRLEALGAMSERKRRALARNEAMKAACESSKHCCGHSCCSEEDEEEEESSCCSSHGGQHVSVPPCIGGGAGALAE